jgi:YHS domain-containing protein
MKSLICPACGCCSLVRLGVSRERAARAEHEGTEYLFCCEGCRSIFESDPEIDVTVAIEHNGTTVHLCRCPGCSNRFRADPEGVLARLAA